MKKILFTVVIIVSTCSMIIAQPAYKPFEIKGVLPWHNFLSGPSAWNSEDYRKYLDDCQKNGINFIAFHNYTGGAERYITYVEPIIKISWRNIVPEAYFDNSLTARWGYYPLKLKDFAFGTGKIFSDPANYESFGANCSIQSKTKEEHYFHSQLLMQQVIKMAHDRKIKVAIGFEFGVHPPEYYSVKLYGSPHSYWNGSASMIPNPTSPEAREILYATIDNLIETYPDLDWIWLWLNEHTMFGVNGSEAVKEKIFSKIFDKNKYYFTECSPDGQFLGVWSLEYITLAYNYIKEKRPGIKIGISGWGGGDQLPPILSGLDKALPKDILFSCLNPGQGQGFHMPVMADIAKNRKVLSIPWLEGDESLWHFQPRSVSLAYQVRKAREDNLAGVVCIHWRTEETKLNFKMFTAEANDEKESKSVKERFYEIISDEYGHYAADIFGETFYKIDSAQLLRQLRSPEYASYEPYWGQMNAELKQNIKDFIVLILSAEKNTKEEVFIQNLQHLRAEMTYSLLLDEVGKKMEKAYNLKQRILMGNIDELNKTILIKEAITDLKAAPVEKMLLTFSSKIRSRGELGVLSSINQKLWVLYKELLEYFEVSK
jgi:hypothetical protein